MQRDNIKHDALAAFRYYAQSRAASAQITHAEDIIIIAAVASTLHHLHIEQRDKTLDVIRLICFNLPPGNLPRGDVTARVEMAAERLNMSVSCVWRELRRAYRVYDGWYAAFTSLS